MNLRILKKLSKRAAPLLLEMVKLRMICEEEVFPAKKDENYHGLVIRDRSCWERTRCHPSYAGGGGEGEIVIRTRAGNVVSLHQPPCPLKGTPMVGGMSGYYEPEWSEETTWGRLHQIVLESFTEYSDDGEDSWPTRSLKNPSEVFAAARDLIGGTEKLIERERKYG